MYTNGLTIVGTAAGDPAGAPTPVLRAAGGGTGQSGDPALIAAVRAGRRSAVGVLYRMYRADALGLARSLLRNDHDAEDVLHEAFAKTIKAIDNGYGPSENFLAYLYTAVKATAAGWWKTNLREVPVETGGLEQGQAHDGRLEAVVDRADNERILQALKSPAGPLADGALVRGRPPGTAPAHRAADGHRPQRRLGPGRPRPQGAAHRVPRYPQ